jgi:dephospho-CoA kinase
MWKMFSREPQARATGVKPVLGLLGGMGSGKSSVAAEFAKHGGKVISADQLGHEALRQPEIRDAIVKHFGGDIVAKDGSIDRKKLGAKVFVEERERKALEKLVHPWITRRIDEEIAQANAQDEVLFIVLDAAIMLEAGWNNVCDWLVYIHVPREQRLQRLAQHRGWSEREVAARERAQMPLGEKRRRADFTIDNAGSPEKTARQVDELVARVKQKRRI